MDTIQIYPQVRGDGYSQDFSDWLRDALKAADKEGFDRGVRVTFWFFYKLFNRE